MYRNTQGENKKENSATATEHGKTLSLGTLSSLPISGEKMIRSAVAVRGKKGVSGNITANAGDVKVRAVIGNAVFGNGSTVDVDDFSLSLEKPGFFIVDYDVPNQDFRFQFMNTVNILEKQFNWTYFHSRNDNRTVLDGSLVLDQANKVSASYKLGSRNCKLKYSYVYRGITAVEPGYDFEKNSWDLAVSHRLDNDVVRVSYENVSKNLGVEWSWKSLLSPEGGIKRTGLHKLANANYIFGVWLIGFSIVQDCASLQNANCIFSISASFNLAEGLHMPKLSAESSWNFEM